MCKQQLKQFLSIFLPQVLCCIVLEYIRCSPWNQRASIGDKNPYQVGTIFPVRWFWSKLLCSCGNGYQVLNNGITTVTLSFGGYSICVRSLNYHYHGTWDNPSYSPFEPSNHMKCVEMTPDEDYLIYPTFLHSFLWINLSQKCIYRIVMKSYYYFVQHISWDYDKEELTVLQKDERNTYILSEKL